MQLVSHKPLEMAKSYKITHIHKFDSSSFTAKPFIFAKQLQIEGTLPGPQTKIYSAGYSPGFRDYEPFEIEHEYGMHIYGRLYDDGRSFSKIIAQSHIHAYVSPAENTLLLCGKKADVLDFCRRTEEMNEIQLSTIQIDMTALQERLPEVRGVWFRFRGGFIHAKAFMGQQIQDTSEYKQAAAEGDISTLSFYYQDPRNALMHPTQITEDGAVVLQKNYGSVGEELDFVLHVRQELLEGIYSLSAPTKTRRAVGELPS